MPFGLCNAPATFQRLINEAMAGMEPMPCLVYLDDIIVHPLNLLAHLDWLRLLFDRLLVTGLKLKVSKCRLLQTEVGVLGWTPNKHDGFDPGPRRDRYRVREWRTPSVLQMCGPSSASVLTIGSLWEVLPT